MPLSAAEVRRRGDRIRRRRNALVAGGAALAVAAVAVPVFAIGSGDPRSDDRDRIAGDPTETPAQVLTQDDLITDDDTEHGDTTDWFTVDTFEGDGQAAFHPCAQDSLSALGATEELQRTFEMRNLEPGAPEVTGSSLVETIALFPDEDSAENAADQVDQWIRGCTERLGPEFRVSHSEPAVVRDGSGERYDLQWPYPEAEYEEAYMSETGVVTVGDRLVVLTLVTVGQDYNFLPEEGGTPVERMLPIAAERLAPED